MRKLEKEFSFAGFNFPKYLWTLPKGPWHKRLEHMRKPVTGGYYGSPKPKATGHMFYLESDFMPGLRWKWADEIYSRGSLKWWKNPYLIPHKGWFCDEYQEETIRGLVMRLPNNRGFLAGWSMGKGMSSHVDYDVFLDEVDAAQCADSMAENEAKREREYQAEMEAERDAEDERIENRFRDAMECGV